MNRNDDYLIDEISKKIEDLEDMISDLEDLKAGLIKDLYELAERDKFDEDDY